MATPTWQPGHLYPPGSLVVPRTMPPVAPVAITNPGFESDATDWTLDAGVTISTEKKFDGSKSVRFSGNTGVQHVLHDAVPCAPGKSITASCMYQQGAASSGNNTGCVLLRFFDASDVQIGADHPGNLITSSSGGFKASAVTVQSPAGTASVSIGALSNRSGNDPSFVDHFTWNLQGGFPSGLVFRAVQPETGYSDTVEPAWPTVNGEQVVDNEVIWEAVYGSRVVWEASPILTSGGTEPEWPTNVGDAVADNTISWQAVSRRVEDPKCPNSKVVVIMASKVFATDVDIVRFSATTNPLDWSSEENAGYLPTGLQSANANDMAVLQQYRGNLVAFNASSFQNWQVDPDPAMMAILDQMEGIGSTWYRAAQSVGNELLFLSQQGFRSVGIAAGAENLAAGDVGEPVDELVQAAVNFIGPTGKAISTYYPGAGQFWGCFPFGGASESWVYVYTMSGKKGKWSRYHFPYAIECFAQLGNDLYIRHGNTIVRVDADAASDEVGGEAVDFSGTVWWPHLDFGSPGQTKMLEGFDYIGTGQGPSIQIGYDQRNVNTLTPAYQLENDTVPGGIIPLPVSAPSLSVKLTFAGGAKWSVQAVDLRFFGLGNGP